MHRIYAAMEDELLVIEDVEHPQAEHRLEGFRPQCLAADPQRPELLYCGTADRGLWRSADAGVSWEPVGEGLSHTNVTAVAVSAAEQADGPGVVYAGTEPSALFRSEDGGNSWRELESMRELPSSAGWSFPPKPNTSHVRWISPDPTQSGRLFVCIEAGALIHSDDGGESWHDKVPDGPLDTHTLAVHEDAPGRLYSAAGDGSLPMGRGYMQSLDAGESWTRPDEGLVHQYLWGLAVNPTDPDTAVVSAASSPFSAHFPATAQSTLYRREGGGPWHEVRGGLPDPAGTVVSVLASNENEPGVFYALNNHGVYRSADAGREWERLEVPWPERYLRQHPQALLVTEDTR